MKKLYLLLCAAGTIIPYCFFIPFLQEYGFNLNLLFQQLFANRISSFFAADFFISCIVFWVFVYINTKRYGIWQWWICIIMNLTVGLSLALPLFLYFKEVKLEQLRAKS